MAKAVETGAVKTRLVPPLTFEEAAKLSACFIADLAQRIGALNADSGCHGFVAYTPIGGEGSFSGLLPPQFRLVPQRGEDLGARIWNAFDDFFALGFEGVCLLNSDGPTLPSAYLQAAAHALHAAGDRVVLGPADDGGYYLVGLKRPHHRLFEDIAWSTARVLSQTLARAAEIGLEVARLPTWYDVDDQASLRTLYNELVRGDVPFGFAPAPKEPAVVTRKLLVELVARHGEGRLGLSDEANIT